MQALLAVSRMVDRLNEWIGRGAAWLVLAAVLVSSINAVVRKAFDMSSNAWLELQWYLFGATFMLAASWTLKLNEHVRIDVLSSSFSRRTRQVVDLICHIVMLMPFVVLMVWLGWPYVLLSFAQQESSANAGGLIIWPAKALVLAGFAMLTAQGLSEIIKRVAVLTGDLPYDDDQPKSDPQAEIIQEIRGERSSP